MADNDDLTVKCSSCGHNLFIDIGVTWVGANGVEITQIGEKLEFHYDNTETETYFDVEKHMYYECLECATAYIVDDNKLIKIDAGNFKLDSVELQKDTKILKNKRDTLIVQVADLKKNIEKMKIKAKELEKFIAISHKHPEKSILKGLRNIKNK